MNDEYIQGTFVTLRPATLKDRRMIYEWLAHSDVTPSMIGPPTYPDHAIPTWEEFCDDYLLHYFSDDCPELGRCFVIMANNNIVGQVNYNRIDNFAKWTELDIWMCSEENCGKGFGPDALKTLCEYLFANLDVLEFFIQPSSRNRRAIRAYEKAGFQKTGLSVKEAESVYGHASSTDSVYMVKKMGYSRL